VFASIVVPKGLIRLTTAPVLLLILKIVPPFPGGKSHLLRQTMGSIEDKLDPKLFLRIHRSAIVHAMKIREVVSLGNREFMVRLGNGTEIKASRRYSERIERWL
jgi:DNA-binding LytR/AlgR family response regulator